MYVKYISWNGFQNLCRHLLNRTCIPGPDNIYNRELLYVHLQWHSVEASLFEMCPLHPEAGGCSLQELPVCQIPFLPVSPWTSDTALLVSFDADDGRTVILIYGVGFWKYLKARN